MAGDSLQPFVTNRMPGGVLPSTSFSSGTTGAGGSAVQAFNGSLGIASPDSPLGLTSVISASSAVAGGIGATNTTRALVETPNDNAAENGDPNNQGNGDAQGDPQVTRDNGEGDSDGQNPEDGTDPDDIDGGGGAGGGLNQYSLLNIDWDRYVLSSDPIYSESEQVKQESIEMLERDTIVKPMISALGTFQSMTINLMRKNQAEEEARIEKILKGKPKGKKH